jgi:acyl-coenzyme A synthetase/AMP-(fatty) acid ligase
MAEWLALNAVATRPLPGRKVASRLDHAAFRAQAGRWREAFSRSGGDKWAFYFDDAAAFCAALFGAWHAGKTVVLCPDALPETLARLRSDVDGFAGDVPEACHPLVIPARDVADETTWPPLDERAARLVVFTSGSTGTPVGIDKTLAQLAREVEALERAFGALAEGAIVHGTVSHQHIYGLLFRALWPLAAGREVAPRLFFHEELVAALDAPSVLISSPAHLKRIPEALDWQGVQTHVRAVFSSGGALPESAAADALATLGQVPIEIYGSSETGGVAWRRCGERSPEWVPLPGVDWRIVDGQLEVASPHLPDAGWWRSADQAQPCGERGFELLGRADRIVKVEERRVSLPALERQLMAVPEVAEARVLLLEGARAQLAAVVVPSEAGVARLHALGRRAFAQALGQALAGGYDAVTRPRRWRFVDVLPANAQGKTTDAALRALFNPDRPAPQWVRRDETQAELEIELDPALAVFDGHFPQAPILPGVAQLDWAVRYGREAFALPPDFLRMEALKFQRVARPGMRIRLQLEWLPQKSALAFHYASEQGPHASGRLVFGEAAP